MGGYALNSCTLSLPVSSFFPLLPICLFLPFHERVLKTGTSEEGERNGGEEKEEEEEGELEDTERGGGGG